MTAIRAAFSTGPRWWQDVRVTATQDPGTALRRRSWVPDASEDLVADIASQVSQQSPASLRSQVEALVEENADIHDRQCVNLNPATNTMNPRAEALLSKGMSARTSLGYPGAKYEMGLEAIEQIEVIAAELAAQVFHAQFAEIRVPSGAMANLYAFMACAEPGDRIIAPPSSIAGHVTHHGPGAAGLYGLEIHDAPVDAERYTIDVNALADQADRVRPKLISVGSSLNLEHHDVAGIRAVADAVGAKVLFDAAHLSGVIAGGVWPNPLHEGAHLMTMSTYKSLGGPTAGLLLTNEPELAERVDGIAFPGLTANFDVAKSAALAITLADWVEYGEEYASVMVDVSRRLAAALEAEGAAVFATPTGHTRSHAFALRALEGGGQYTAEQLRRANLLTSAIGLPGDPDGGVRIGTNEMVRWGMEPEDAPDLAHLLARAAVNPESMASAVSTFRQRFVTLRFVRS